MLNEQKFVDLSHALASGLFADSVVFAIARSQNLHRVESQDVSTIKLAADFFTKALKGSNWLESDTLAFDEKSVETVSYFDRAVRVVKAVKQEVTSPEAFRVKITQLKKTADILAQGTVPGDESQVKELRKFFADFARNELSNTQQILEGSEV